MGEVYLARDTFLDRAVAVKVLPLQRSGDARFRERMQREAAAAARVEHPNLVRVFDAGITDDNVVFLVLEYLADAATLRSRLRASALGWPEFAALSDQLASVLASIHAAGIVHRDLKPENIMVDRDGRLVLIDFGLARVRTHALRTTTKGLEQAMSPHYSSPEQLLGDTLGPPTDVYSLGVVLWEMASGLHPFHFSRGSFPSVQTVSVAHVFAEVAPLTAARSDAPEGLSSLLAACLAKDPSARPSASEVASALRALTPMLVPSPNRPSSMMTPRGTVRLLAAPSPIPPPVVATELLVAPLRTVPASPPPHAPAPTRGARRWPMAIALVVAALAAGAAWWAYAARSNSPPSRTDRGPTQERGTP
jgi:serine/threonine-protein kinase